MKYKRYNTLLKRLNNDLINNLENIDIYKSSFENIIEKDIPESLVANKIESFTYEKKIIN